MLTFTCALWGITFSEVQTAYQKQDQDTLLSALNSTNASVVNEAIQSLGKLNNRDAVDPLMQWFEKHPDFANEVVPVIVSLGGHEVWDELVRKMNDPLYHSKIRNTICLNLISVAYLDECKTLFAYFDQSFEVPSMLTNALADRFHLNVLDELRPFLSTARNPKWIIQMWQSLGQESLLVLTEWLNQPAMPNREILFQAWLGLNPPDRLSLIETRYLNDPEPAIRILGLRYLLKANPVPARLLIRDALISDNLALRQYAASVFIDNNWVDMAPELYFRYDALPETVQPQVLQVLTSLNYKQFVVELSQKLASDQLDPNLRSAAIFGMKYLIPRQSKVMYMRARDVATLSLTKQEKVFLSALIRFSTMPEYKEQAEKVLKELQFRILE